VTVVQRLVYVSGAPGAGGKSTLAVGSGALVSVNTTAAVDVSDVAAYVRFLLLSGVDGTD
jgi:hypothetical protein